MAAKWLKNNQQVTTVLQQLADYKNKAGAWADELVHGDARNMPPTAFWQIHGAVAPELQDIAIKALAVDTSIMDVEKANSLLKQIWNQGSAIMTPEKAVKLLAIRYNRTTLKDVAAKGAPTAFYRDVEPAIRKQGSRH